MDRQLRMLERLAALGDLDAQRELAMLRHRGATRMRKLSAGNLVRGELIAETLRAALERTGKREVELLREGGVPEKHHSRHIRALRDLIANRARSWVWLERWVELLAPTELAYWRRQVTCVPHPGETPRV